MLRKSFNYIYQQRNLRFSTRLDYWLFQDGCQIAVNTDAGLTEHTDSGFADNKYCFKSVFIMDFLTLFYCTDPSCRHATGRLSCTIFVSTAMTPFYFNMFIKGIDFT